MKQSWNGHGMDVFSFEGYEARLVFPKQENSKNILVLKTEYWNAFPDIEQKLVTSGFHLAWLKNETRFATKEDCERKSRFVSYLSEQYGLQSKCVLVGYSCGGAHAINFAGVYPELVFCIFLDAPVLNFCSYPGKLGNAACEEVWKNEFVQAYPQISRRKLLNFDGHPICKADVLVQHRIPILMLYGTEDQTVPYEENGKLLEEAYAGTSLLTVIPVALRGHHPHGMLHTEENETVVKYVIQTTKC